MKTESINANQKTPLVVATVIGMLFLIAGPPPVLAQQWTNNGNNISNTNSGNVSITGDEPSGDYATLRVKPTVTHGGIVIDSANNASQVHLRFYKNGVPKWQFRVPFQQSEDLRIYSWAANSDVLSINPAGNVGIGTTSPSTVDDINLSTARILQVSGADTRLVVTGATRASFDMIDSGASANQKWLNFASDDGKGYIRGSTENGTVTYNFLVADMSNGNVGIGTSSPQYKLDVAGNINSNATITGNNIVAKYQDVAEWVPSSEKLAAGTVVVLDASKSNQVIASSQSYDTRVAGVISAQPGIALGEKSENKVLVATTGRVKVKVDATKSPIHIGDLLVTSDIPGVAMKSVSVNIGGVQIHRPGTLIGKALEPLAKGSGEILVLLSLQ